MDALRDFSRRFCVWAMPTKAAKKTAVKKQVTQRAEKKRAKVSAQAQKMTPNTLGIPAAARTCRKLHLAPQCGLDGSTAWSAGEKALFLKCLELYGTVSAAARAIGKKADAAQRLRIKDAVFAEAWAQAMEASVDALEGEVLSRAIRGVTRNKYYGGAVIGSDVFYSDQLAMFLLRALRPAVYGKQDGDAQPLPETEEEFRHRIGERLQRIVAEERGGLVVDLVTSLDEMTDDQ